jgi:parallel beta-helix repeat protein
MMRKERFIEIIKLKMLPCLIFFCLIITYLSIIPDVKAQDQYAIYVSDDYTLTEDIGGYKLIITADDVQINGNGHTLTGPGTWVPYPAVIIEGRKNVTINNLNFKDWGLGGVQVVNSINCTISNCYSWSNANLAIISNSERISINDSWSNDYGGVILDWSMNCNISHNLFTSWFGIRLTQSPFNNIYNNTFKGGYGIVLDHSYKNELINNNLTSCYEAIWLKTSNKTIIHNNNITANQEGLRFESSNWCQIENNSIKDNPTNVKVLSGSGNVFTENNISGNGNNAMMIYDSGNLICYNNFLGQGYWCYSIAPNLWYDPSKLEGNYWSTYPGIDDGSGIGKHAIAGDGIGDTSIPWPRMAWPYYDLPLDEYPFVAPSQWEKTRFVYAPEIISLNTPVDPVLVESSVYVTALFIDQDQGDIHVASWDWGDGSVDYDHVDRDSGFTDCLHTYTTPGVYTITVTVTDSVGLSDSASSQNYVVVYDPEGGFVTGGGWIYSPVGAYLDDVVLSGKATFGFVSKYQKGASVPSGNTEFQFQVGNLNFHSTSYNWLVVNQGGTNAQFFGDGTINGASPPNGQNYKFMIWAGDHSPDTFRIKIWYEDGSGEHVVYDNGVQQAIGGGSIVVHTK